MIRLRLGSPSVKIRRETIMRKLLYAAVILACAAPVSFAQAQTDSGTPNSSSSQPAQNNAMQPSGWKHHHMGGPMGEHGWMKHHPPMMFPAMMFNSKAAFFQFRKGKSSMTIKCADDESMKACVNAAGQLMNQLGKMKNHSQTGGNGSH
jgi:hypothetical protein